MAYQSVICLERVSGPKRQERRPNERDVAIKQCTIKYIQREDAKVQYKKEIYGKQQSKIKRASIYVFFFFVVRFDEDVAVATVGVEGLDASFFSLFVTSSMPRFYKVRTTSAMYNVTQTRQ